MPKDTLKMKASLQLTKYYLGMFPLLCFRRVGVDGVSVVPMWLPHLSSHAAEHSLHFTLQLMTSEWKNVWCGLY